MHEAQDSIVFALFTITITSAIVLLGLRQLRVAIVSGLVGAGAVIAALGQGGFNVLHDQDAPQTLASMANIGALMLFLCHGLDMSVDRLLQSWRPILIIGSVQFLLTVLLGFFAGCMQDLTYTKALFSGILMAPSSAMLVFYGVRETGRHHGEEAVVSNQILLFHDLSLLPIALLIPAMAPNAEGTFEWFYSLAIGIVLIAGVLALEYRLVCPVLDWVGKSAPREIFHLSLAAVLILSVLIAIRAKLSPEFGMLIGGVLISRSRFRHYVHALAQQLRDIALPLFLISFGILMKWGVFLDHWPIITLSLLGLVAIKLFAGMVAALVAGLHLKTAIRVGGLLAHMGELSFVLGAMAHQFHILDETDSDVFLVLAVVSVAISPWVNRGAEWVAQRVPDLGIRDFGLKRGLLRSDEYDLILHAVIIGFGRVGQEAARMFRDDGQQFIVIEMNHTLADLAEKLKYRVIPGDANMKRTIDKARCERAQLIMVTAGTTDLVAHLLAHLGDDYRGKILVRIRGQSEAEGVAKEFGDAIDVISDEQAVTTPILAHAADAMRIARPENSSGKPVSAAEKAA